MHIAIQSWLGLGTAQNPTLQLAGKKEAELGMGTDGRTGMLIALPGQLASALPTLTPGKGYPT